MSRAKEYAAFPGLLRRSFITGIAVAGLLAMGAASGCGAQPQKAASTTQAVAPADPAPPPEKTAGFDGNKAFAHVERVVAIGPRPPGSDGIHKTQEYIRAQLQSFGCAVDEDAFHASTPLGQVEMRNFLVKIPGAKSDVVMFTGHYDTKLLPGFVGADDGGSSTGVLLELARVLCGRKGALTVWIAFFDGEEAFEEWGPTDSVYGSRQMAAKLAPSGDLKRIKAMLLADLIGNRNLRVRREENSTKWLTDLVWSVAARLGYQNIFVSEAFPVDDDHMPFLRRGVACVDVIDLEAPYWHTNEDTLDKISPRSLAIIGHVFLETLGDLEKKFR